MAEPKTELRDGKPIHFSVGAIIEKDGQTLLIDRANPPYGLACPAGHVDTDEEPEPAMRREVLEETGLEVVNSELLIEEFVPWNKCTKGVQGHYWYVFRVEAEGDLKPKEREAKSTGWYALKNVAHLEPVWEYWFEKLELS